ncbi:MAG: prolipoprotein diacylglyceryl transferase [Alphaproteobacteria bacterium]|nr:prolipoprotein diacylglyceryl transferase [Alphaproteobacteria bacterium]
MLAIGFPLIDPVAIELGPLVIRWYSLAYVVGIMLGWRYMLRLAGRPPKLIPRLDIDDFILWATLGVILGGRLGYVLFYRPGYYFDNPAQILAVWKGGMAFHGATLGVLAATILFTWRRRISLLGFGDLICAAAPVGLFLGRLANFINGELFGRATDVPWAMVFPRGGPLPRHPSQLYEAALEGLVLFLILLAIDRLTGARARHGFLIGVFLTGYGAFRSFVEFFREPDAHLGFLVAGATMGQILSLPLLALGLYFIAAAVRRP